MANQTARWSAGNCPRHIEKHSVELIQSFGTLGIAAIADGQVDDVPPRSLEKHKLMFLTLPFYESERIYNACLIDMSSATIHFSEDPAASATT